MEGEKKSYRSRDFLKLAYSVKWRPATTVNGNILDIPDAQSTNRPYLAQKLDSHSEGRWKTRTLLLYHKGNIDGRGINIWAQMFSKEIGDTGCRQLLQSWCESITGSPTSPNVVMTVPDASKVFTGTVVESALDMFEKWEGLPEL
ncbi:hypothetical protein PANDA_014706 [Ailuropoda melanoleuca]|uniref:Uncharacterized protein n=1 Tax=Ailuropoda melanoleuca TaxID=9646 RepID=D2HRR8_AILME|nr:hypothetical protein PANDA_014706 [Ailuropoda melanoleuca]